MDAKYMGPHKNGTYDKPHYKLKKRIYIRRKGLENKHPGHEITG